MRIWDVPCDLLTDKHLLGEHVEVHTIWNTHVRGSRAATRAIPRHFVGSGTSRRCASVTKNKSRRWSVVHSDTPRHSQT